MKLNGFSFYTQLELMAYPLDVYFQGVECLLYWLLTPFYEQLDALLLEELGHRELSHLAVVCGPVSL
jgi:hypothetical protein